MRLEVSPGVVIDYHTMALSRIVSDDELIPEAQPDVPRVTMDKAPAAEAPTTTSHGDPRPHDG
jgi:hypothetical protein